jgi:subtilisin family serine protease
MSRRYLPGLAFLGLVLFALAGVLLAGGRSFPAAVSPPDQIPAPDGPAFAVDADELAAGGLFLLRPGEGTPPDWAARLKAQGIQVGSATGDGAHLVRVPGGTALDTLLPAGAVLEPHRAASRLSPHLSAVDGPSELTVNVSLFEPADKPSVAERTHALGGTVLRGLDEEEGAALRVRLPADRLPELAAAPGIVYVEAHTATERLNDRARDVIAATPVTVPGFITPAGLSGAGQIVALADSGLDKGSLTDVHPDLASTPGQMPKIVFLSPLSGHDPSDPVGHGTHMAATIAGTGRASGGQHRGVAPEASLFVQSILNRKGKLDPPADLVTLFRPAYEAGARVHVNGWGGHTNAYLGAASQVDRFVRYYPDFLVVFGAGNSGPGAATLTPEANSKNSLVVGASQNPRPAFGPDSQDAASLTSFSSRGPTGDGRLKPDLVVPGSAVVSACSSLVQGNFEAHPDYTRLQGTSMSAALAGGAAALVREYLQKHEGARSPSAALVKALLINGARPLEGGPAPESGFGLLDLAGTLLALNEGTFFYKEGDTVGTGERLTYTFHVANAGAPFKATLAWTDPPAAPGAAKALVNDLDLTVTSPDGKTYQGNDFGGRGAKDAVNNVEQVIIVDPVPGEYRVTISGAAVSHSVRPGTTRPVQDFALVCGRPPVKERVVAGDHRRLLLADGSEVSLAGARVTAAVNEELRFPRVPAGADAYFPVSGTESRKVFLAAREWHAPAVKCLPGRNGDHLVLEMNRLMREGGYFLAPGRPVLLNGTPLTNPANLPAGAEVHGYVNPSTQRVWRLEAGYREERGVLAAIEHATGRLRLLNDNAVYQLTPDTALALTQTVVGGDRANLPFGASAEADPRHLYPGVAVRLIMSPHTNRVNHLVATHHVVVGTLRDSPGPAGTIAFTNEQRYTALPGITVERDGVADGLAALRAGDLVFAAVVPGERNIIGITAHSASVYGQLIYAGSETVYLSDYRGRLHTLRLTGETRVYRWDLAGDAALLTPGLVVRVALVPGTREIVRIDVADSERREAAVQAYDRERAVLHTAGGESYPVTANASFTKNGFPVQAHDLVPGEAVNLTILSGTTGGEVLIRGAASTLPQVAEPDLRVESIIPLSDRYVVTGRTTADRLYAWGESAFQQLELTPDGSFYLVVPYSIGVRGGELVAVDSRTGGVAGRQVTLPARSGQSFNDISGSWARTDIEQLLARGLVSGYPDGTFRPDRSVSRAEFTVLLARLLGLPAAGEPGLPFTDAAAIPGWARESIALAHARGIIDGYEDNTFRPHAPISRTEAAAILIHSCVSVGMALPQPTAPAPYSDWYLIPEWGRSAVAQAHTAGLMFGLPDDRFAPAAALSRAETAAILNRLLQNLEQ